MQIKRDKKGHFIKGSYVGFGFKKQHKPWNKELKGIHLSPKTEFKKGIRYSPATEFKKGNKPLNPIRKNEHRGIKTEFISERVKGDKNIKWKADNVGYGASHGWMLRNFGKASKCENKKGKLGFKCKKISKNYDWAFLNKKGYTRDRGQYMELCHSCHLTYDRN